MDHPGTRIRLVTAHTTNTGFQLWSGRYLAYIIATMICIALLIDVFKITGEMKVIAGDTGVSVSNASPWMSSVCVAIHRLQETSAITGQPWHVIVLERFHNLRQLLSGVEDVLSVSAADSVPSEETSRGLSSSEFVNFFTVMRLIATV